MPKKDDDAKKPASETVPDQRWKLQVFYLCFYGFMTQIRPGESFITPYLLGADKNFTQAEVSHGQPVPRPGVPLSGHDHYPGAGQSILSRSRGMEACGDTWWCFLDGGEKVACVHPAACPCPAGLRGHPVPSVPGSAFPGVRPRAEAGRRFWGAMPDPCLPGQPVGWQGGAGLGEAPSHPTGETLPCWHGAQCGTQGWALPGCWQRWG